MLKSRKLLAVLAAAVLPALFLSAGCGSSADSSADSDRDRDRERERAAIKQLIRDVDQGQLCNRKFYGQYTDSTADLELMVGGRIVGPASEHRLDLTIDASEGGRSYIVRIIGATTDTNFSRRGSDFVDYGDSGVVPPNTCARDKPSPYRPRR